MPPWGSHLVERDAGTAAGGTELSKSRVAKLAAKITVITYYEIHVLNKCMYIQVINVANTFIFTISNFSR